MLKKALPFLFACAGLWSATAKADAVDCQPTRVRSSQDRMDMRCQNVNRWFIAMRSQTDPEHLKEMLSLVNSAILAGKSIKIYYTLENNNGMIWAIEVFA